MRMGKNNTTFGKKQHSTRSQPFHTELRQPGTVTARSEYTPQMTPYVYEVCVPEYPVLSIVNARAQDADAGSARNKARNPRL
jgi:hypothetical protein